MVGGGCEPVKARGGNVDRPALPSHAASGSTHCRYVDTMQAFVFVVAAALGGITAAQILPTGYVVETLAPGQTGPTSLDFLPDGRVLFVEQDTGAVKVLAIAASNAVATLGAVPGLRVSYSQGLLGVAVDPQWPARPFVYCVHTNLAAADLRITRFAISG